MTRLHLSFYISAFVLLGVLGYLAHQFTYLPGDIALSQWLQQSIPSGLGPVMQGISSVSSVSVAAVIVAAVAAGLWLSGRKRESIFVAGLTSTAAILNWILKLVISRPRPDGNLIQVIGPVSGFSFPSGHVTYAFVFYGFLFYLAPRLVITPARCVALRTGLSLIILLTIVSRLYLGIHWLSDALGSLLLGSLLVALAVAWYNRSRRPQHSNPTDKAS
jgi:membrane-associated phospholipid phosphatase